MFKIRNVFIAFLFIISIMFNFKAFAGHSTQVNHFSTTYEIVEIQEQKKSKNIMSGSYKDLSENEKCFFKKIPTQTCEILDDTTFTTIKRLAEQILDLHFEIENLVEGEFRESGSFEKGIKYYQDRCKEYLALKEKFFKIIFGAFLQTT